MIACDGASLTSPAGDMPNKSQKASRQRIFATYERLSCRRRPATALSRLERRNIIGRN